MRNIDQLVRLNIGEIPIEAAIQDWASVQGDLLYKLLLARGGTRFIRVPLDLQLIASIRASGSDRMFSLYRDGRDRITPIARFVVLYCLEEGVPIPAISRLVGVSEGMIRRLRSKRQQAPGVVGRTELLALLRDLAFERRGGGTRWILP